MTDINAGRETRTRGIDWGTAVVAGAVAGLVFLMLEMLLMPTLGSAPSMWAPPRMIGAIGLGPDVLPPPATFDLTVVMVAMVIHFMTSILFAVVVAHLIRAMTVGTAIAVGVVAALLLYGFVFYIMTSGPWPWFVNGRNWINVMVHIIFGGIVGWWYKTRAHRAEPYARV